MGVTLKERDSSRNTYVVIRAHCLKYIELYKYIHIYQRTYISIYVGEDYFGTSSSRGGYFQ